MKKALLILLIVLTPIRAHAGFGGDCVDLMKTMWGDKYDPLGMKIMGRGILLLGAGAVAGVAWLIGSSIQEHYEVKAILRSLTTDEKDAMRKLVPGPGEHKVAQLDDETYFVRESFVFKMGGSLEPESIGKKKAVSLQPYNNILVARTESGQVSVYTPGHGRWFDFGIDATQVVSTKDSVYALSRDGKLWKMKAAPGNLHVFGKDTSYTTTTVDSGGNVQVQYVPDTTYYLYDSRDRPVTFEVESASGVSGIALAPDGGVKITQR